MVGNGTAAKTVNGQSRWSLLLLPLRMLPWYNSLLLTPELPECRNRRTSLVLPPCRRLPHARGSHDPCPHSAKRLFPATTRAGRADSHC